MIELLRFIIFGRKFIFEHEQGVRHTVWAYSRSGAWRQMRSFVHIKMFGGFAFFYDPVKLEQQVNKIRLVEE